MAEFKKISDVDVVTDLTENDNVLVIGSDGALKQTASSNVKGSTSWNDLTDKPFGEAVQRIVFNGNIEGKETVDANGVLFVKVSDEPVSEESIIGGKYTVTPLADDAPSGTTIITEDMLRPTGQMCIVGEGYVVSVSVDGAVVPWGDTLNRGVYFAFADGAFYCSELVYKQVKKIDEKYLPDMGSSGSGSCGIEYWTGDVTWDSESNMFTLQGLELSMGEEVEIGIKLNGNSNAPCCAKYSFISGTTNNNNGIAMYSLEYAHNTLYPRARLSYQYSDSVYQLYLTGSTEADAVSIFNPQILFVRVYRMV
jgi:hypothetical protein